MPRGQNTTNPFQGKVVYSILVSVIIFLLCQFFLLSRDFAGLDDQKMTLEAEIGQKKRQLEEYKQKIWVKERDTHRIERKLHELESKLRGRRELMGKAAVSLGNALTIFMVTPTYSRPTQKADLTRLSYTLLHVPNLHWVLVEDAKKKSELVRELLDRSGLKYTHLAVLTPVEHKLNASNPNWLKPRGVTQRNGALKWIRTNLIGGNGVVYFGDDDNTYDVRLFEEMRNTTKVSVWPVALVGGLLVERPLVNEGTGKVVDWLVGWAKERPFPIDMAGFAVNLKLLLAHPEAIFSYEVQRGYQESHLLQKLVTMEELEPKADLCSKVYVWHTRTEKPKLKNENRLIAAGIRSNEGIEL